jgi:hypothetical protein
LTRTIGRRLERLEVRAQQIVAATPEPHTIRFIDMDMRVVGLFEKGTGKWVEFNPPRDRAEFEPIL